MNFRSLKNKSAAFVDYIQERQADVVALTEIWQNEMDSAVTGEATPTGYKFLDHPRPVRTGGGTGVLFKESITVKQFLETVYDSSEYLDWSGILGLFRMRLIVVYRPPHSTTHPVTTNTFLAEFSQYFESIVIRADPLLIVGDFNIHVEIPNDFDGQKFL